MAAASPAPTAPEPTLACPDGDSVPDSDCGPHADARPDTHGGSHCDGSSDAYGSSHSDGGTYSYSGSDANCDPHSDGNPHAYSNSRHDGDRRTYSNSRHDGDRRTYSLCLGADLDAGPALGDRGGGPARASSGRWGWVLGRPAPLREPLTFETAGCLAWLAGTIRAPGTSN